MQLCVLMKTLKPYFKLYLCLCAKHFHLFLKFTDIYSCVKVIVKCQYVKVVTDSRRSFV